MTIKLSHRFRVLSNRARVIKRIAFNYIFAFSGIMMYSLDMRLKSKSSVYLILVFRYLFSAIG